MKTALQEFISDILNGKVIDTLSNQQYYLDKEKQQIITAFEAGQMKEAKQEFWTGGTKYFNETFEK